MSLTLRILVLASIALAGCKDDVEGGSASDSSDPPTSTAGHESESSGETEPEPSTGTTEPDLTETIGTGSTSGDTTDATTETTDEPTDDTSSEPMCNNGIIEGDEECDNMEVSFNGPCIPSCILNVCGDGHHNFEGEDCDEGEENGMYGSMCGPDCTLGSAEFCGDGVLQDEYEECEVNDIHEDFHVKCVGCTWANFQIVFVTGFTVDGAMSADGLSNDGKAGVSLADYHCQQIADEMQFPGTYRAWLSDNNGTDTSDAADRIGGSETEYRMPNGGLVAPSWSYLLENGPLDPIEYTEEGILLEETPARVWSNTTGQGESLGAVNCASWTQNSILEEGALGRTLTGFQWTDAGDTSECIYSQRLYCFQEG